MGVGRIGGGGNRGGPKGPKGASKAAGKGPVGKAGGGTYGKVDSTSGLVGASGLVGSSEVGAATVVDQARQIARALKSGEIATKAEAARRLVAGILKEKLDIHSKALEGHIAEAIAEDPRLQQTLERIWQRGE